MTWAVQGYTEIRELGRGASGRVVLAKHDLTGTHLAIKYLAEHLAGDEEFVRAFRAEARILSEVDDPQIAKLYEYVETTEGAAIVMELVDGVALRAILREHGPTDAQAALVVLKGSLLGLAAAHGRGVVHRDYKPENVLVNGEGQSKLADFGIAARAGRQGAMAGTPSYMAPEQWAGAAATPSTDIYAATATFFECLTGHPPFRAPGDLAGLRRQHEQAPIPVEQVPEPLRDLVRRGLNKTIDRRPGDAALFLRELETVAGAGYGPDWEEEGRGSLARRAALLLLLFPLAGAIGGGTGVGQTILGVSTRIRNLLIGGAVAVIVAAGGVGGYVAWDPGASSEAIPPPSTLVTSSPSVSVSPSPDPSPSALPSELPSASPSLSLTTTPPPKPSPSQSKSPTPSPTPPPVAVTSLSVTANYVNPCQLTSCPQFRATVYVTTSDSRPVEVTITFAGSNNTKPGSVNKRIYKATLQGTTKYTLLVPSSSTTPSSPYDYYLACGDFRPYFTAHATAAGKSASSYTACGPS